MELMKLNRLKNACLNNSIKYKESLSYKLITVNNSKFCNKTKLIKHTKFAIQRNY